MVEVVVLLVNDGGIRVLGVRWLSLLLIFL